MKKILDALESILKKLDKLEDSLCRVEERLTKLENIVPACERMDDHVTFVNGVYTTMKAPIEYVCSVFTKTNTKLPCIEQQQHMYLENE
tara:strand:+ start:288 stop:554 length:267 start_codon:yes stop_codon:yes gene_type:complete